MTQQFDLDAASVSELKALAYDQLVTLQQAQNNLAILSKAIEAKQTQPKEVQDDSNITNDSEPQVTV